jgi:Glycosyl hydrolase family 3 N terminal domain
VEACSWDPKTVERAASIAAAEACAAGVRWIFAPMVDIARDSRWGRIVEGAGEDPYLGSVMARARVLGFQGTDCSALGKVLACPEHGWQGGGRIIDCERQFVGCSRLGADFRPSTVVSEQDDASSGSGS